MSILAGSDIVDTDFINESERNATPANDAGKVVKLESDGKIHEDFVLPTLSIDQGVEALAHGDVVSILPTAQKSTGATTYTALSALGTGGTVSRTGVVTEAAGVVASQSFSTDASGFVLKTVTLIVTAAGSTLTLRLRSDSAGVPGAEIASAAIAGTGTQVITLSTTDLEPSTRYWLQVTYQSGVTNGGTVNSLQSDTTGSTLAGETCLDKDNVDFGKDMYFSIGAVYGGKNALIKTDVANTDLPGGSANARQKTVIGLVNGTYSAPASNTVFGTVKVTVQVGGKITGLSGLVAGQQYFLTATAGVMGLTPHDATTGFQKLIGVAISTTELVIMNA